MAETHEQRTALQSLTDWWPVLAALALALAVKLGVIHKVPW